MKKRPNQAVAALYLPPILRPFSIMEADWTPKHHQHFSFYSNVVDLGSVANGTS